MMNFNILNSGCLILICSILYLSICDGKKSHHRHPELETDSEDSEDQGMGGCYSESVPKEERITPAVCNATTVFQASESPFNMTVKWIPHHAGTGDFEVCITSNNDTDVRIYTLTVKEVQHSNNTNPRHGKWKHMGTKLCCFANGRSVEEMKDEVANSTVVNYFEKAVVWESSDLDHCGKWHPKGDIASDILGRKFKFIGISCDEDQKCWKTEVEGTDE